MWRAGLTPELIVWTVNALALLVGAALGARGLIDPAWAARFVRLRADDQGGGFAEFRATYGGLFLASHAVALYFSLRYMSDGDQVSGVFAAGAAAALAAAWAGAAFGRSLALANDKPLRTRFNLQSIAVEAALAAMIAAPWLLWGLRPPG